MDLTKRPTFVCIHTKDSTTQILYMSSGCKQCTGFTPEYLISRSASELIADAFAKNYSQVFAENADNEDDGDASAYVMYMNLVMKGGRPTLHRLIKFKCDNCVVSVGVAFPEVQYFRKNELQVQMLDGAMRRLNIGCEKINNETIVRRHREARKKQMPIYFAKNRQAKAAFVLENPKNEEYLETSGLRQNGPLIAFVTNSISRIVDADTSDLVRFPFLKLVAPEDMVKASRYFDRLSDTPDVLFETFKLLEKPRIIEGDVLVEDRLNMRVEVECLGASVTDGLTLLARKVCMRRPPRDPNNPDEDSTDSGLAEMESDGGYISLSDIISSDPETSDAPVWSRLR